MASQTTYPNPVKDKKDSPGNFGSTGSEMKEKAESFGSSVLDKGKDVASAVANTAQDVAKKAGDVASTVGHKAEEAVSAVGGQMKSLAGTIREKGAEGGVLGSAASSVAKGLETGGTYLQDHNLHGMAEDLTSLIRRYPIQALLVGIGAGFLVARATTSRRS